MNYDEVIDYLTTEVEQKRTINSLHRIQYLLAKLDNPQDQLKNIIHITGTNGKGSTAKFINNLLLVKKYNVALFSSPFVIDFRERIQINNQYISKEDLIEYTKQIKAIIDQYPSSEEIPNRFEIITALMYLYFAKQKADFNIIEVGIGGLFDSTNVLTQAKTVVVTNIALDHEKLLGNSLIEIAKQKAGLISKNTKSVVLGEEIQEKELINIFQAQEKPIILSGNQIDSANLLGYQKQNFNTALTLLKSLGLDFSDLERKKALEQFFMPGRLEFLTDYLLIDGAHNRDGISSLLASLKEAFPKQKINFFVGALAEKNVASTFQNLRAFPNSQLYLVNFAGYHNRQGVLTKQYEKDFQVIKIEEIRQHLNQEAINVVTGSLYFVSEFRKRYQNETI